MRRTLASSSSAPSRSNGVTIAVRMPPMKPTSLSSVRLGAPYRARRTSGTAAANGRIPCRKMQTERDYSHRTTVEKLGVVPAQRVEIAGDVGPGLRRDVKEALGRGLVRSGELDGAIVLVESEDEAKEALVRYRARLRDTGYLWIITRKRGHERYLNQMALVPHAKRLGLIDNKTCSIDDERSGIRFVVHRRREEIDQVVAGDRLETHVVAEEQTARLTRREERDRRIVLIERPVEMLLRLP